MQANEAVASPNIWIELKNYLNLNSYIIQSKQNSNEFMPLASFLA